MYHQNLNLNADWKNCEPMDFDIFKSLLEQLMKNFELNWQAFIQLIENFIKH